MVFIDVTESCDWVYKDRIELTQQNLQDHCLSDSTLTHKDCILVPGRFTIRSNLSVGTFIIPYKSDLALDDCHTKTFVLNLTVCHLIVDGIFRIGDAQQPYGSTASVTLQQGKEIQFGDRMPNYPNMIFNSSINFNIDVVLPRTSNKFIGVRPGGQLELHGKEKKSWTRLIRTADSGDSFICLLESAKELGWEILDQIVISPTDFFQRGSASTETFTVAGITDGTSACDGRTKISFASGQTIRVRKYGNAIQDGYDPRMRAEVGLLSRNIIIEGSSADEIDQVHQISGYGGHTIYLYKSQVHIQNTEFRRMGQNLHMARYPIHWHLAGDCSGHYVRSNSIHSSFQRCITIHGTWGSLEASDNVCFDIVGHAFYWENGIEMDTIVERNLVVQVKKGYLLCSDNTEGDYTDINYNKVHTDTGSMGPSAYWILNGNNHINDNVASAVGNGQSGIGYWFAIPQYIMNPSYDFFSNSTVQKFLNVPSNYVSQDPTDIPMKNFRGNVAHTIFQGMVVDGILRSADNDAGTCVKESAGVWNPKSLSMFEDFLAYKCNLGAWINSNNAILLHPTFIDNAGGLYFEKLQVSQEIRTSRSNLPQCYFSLPAEKLGNCWSCYGEGTEEPGPFVHVNNSIWVGFSKNQLSGKKYQYPGCASYNNEQNDDCKAFGTVGVKVSMGYVYFDNVTISGFHTDEQTGEHRGFFGQKEDPGYNNGPFIITNVHYTDPSSLHSNWAYMDTEMYTGMDVRYKAGHRNFKVYNPDGTLLHPSLQANVAFQLGSSLMGVCDDNITLDSDTKKTCLCDEKNFASGCLCPNLKALYAGVMIRNMNAVQPFPRNVNGNNPSVVDPYCPGSKSKVNPNWGDQHGCILDLTVYASGMDLESKTLVQWVAGSPLLMPAVNGTAVLHLDRVNGHLGDVSFSYQQFESNPDQVSYGDFVILGLKLPTAQGTTVEFSRVEMILSSSDIRTITITPPECNPSICPCCPTHKMNSTTRRNLFGYGFGLTEYNKYKNQSSAPDNPTVQRFFDTNAFPKEVFSMEDLHACKIGWFWDISKAVVWVKITWLIDELPVKTGIVLDIPSLVLTVDNSHRNESIFGHVRT